MNCDCSCPTVYRAKLVKIRKPHKCCECGDKIQIGQHAEKVDALWESQFSTIYTCVDCVGVRDRVKAVFDDENDLCCHGEMFEYLWHSDLLWDEDEIEEEASAWVPDYNESLGVIRGANCVIAVKVGWLRWENGKLRLI